MVQVLFNDHRDTAAACSLLPIRLKVCRRKSSTPSKGFGTEKDAAAASSKAIAQQPAAKKSDKKWILEPVDVPEWLTWIVAQQSAANVADGATLLSTTTNPLPDFLLLASIATLLYLGVWVSDQSFQSLPPNTIVGW